MTTFTKWFLFNALILTASFLAEQQKGWLSMMINNDGSYICLTIMIAYVVVSGLFGVLAYKADKPQTDKERTKLMKSLDLGWFMTEHFFTLGLLGTIIGLCMATGNLSETVSTAEMVKGLKLGLHTAFYTTVTGIIYSLPLQVQLMMLKLKLEKQ